MKSISQRIPQRTCVACRQIKPKRELTRLVCVSSGAVEVEAGLKGNRLDYTLRTTITKENREWLMKYSKDLLEE